MQLDIYKFHVYYVMLVSCEMATLCESIGEEEMNTSVKTSLYNYNVTLNNLNVHVNLNKTIMTNTSKDFRYGNETVENKRIENVTAPDNASNKPDETPLPIPIMVASPAVAVGIFIFICVAYKWHTTQLDAQSKELATKLSASECPSPCIPCSPCHNTHRLLPPSDSMDSTSQNHSDCDSLGARRKGLRTPSPILLVPPGHGKHRGSTLSALSDQEVLSHSPRRHSTFLL